MSEYKLVCCDRCLWRRGHKQRPVRSLDTWTTTNVDGAEQINDVSCPTSGFCAAVDDAGEVLTTTNPRSGPWAPRNIDGAKPIDAIDCPRSTFCVAVDYTGNILVSTAPTAGRWTIRRIDPGTSYWPCRV